MLETREKYELTWLQVVYFVSGLPTSVFLGSHIEMEWDWASSRCESNITAETGKTKQNNIASIANSVGQDYE